ncbi:hypothetical protein B0H63DRAFT_475121 [Podospora didyma]|uniref:Rhodopsin domain-containing protein n=1 Tax=Podospora didyma TaxID=330526 RepID=A0AAE0NGS4_9PEZI|nr:hypothetical protein B0H63DRAFT_475121 [Podospora didyma]
MNATTPTNRPMPDPNVYFGQPILPVAIVSICLSTLFVGMRIWARTIILRVFALEDWFIILGWMFAVATSATNIVELNFGKGRQLATLGLPTLTSFLKVALAVNIVYILSLTFVKISILCLYLRALNYPYVRIATKVLLGIVVVTHLWILATLFTVCVPLDAFWDFTKHGTAYCHPYGIYWGHSGINIATDICIFILPLTVIRKMHAPRREKTALYIVFLLAFCVCAISLARTLQFLRGMLDPTLDTTPDTVIIGCWTMLEVNIAVICACLATIKPLFTRLLPSLHSTQTSSAITEVSGVETIGRARGRRNRSEISLRSDVAMDHTGSWKEAEQPTTGGESSSGPDRV